MIKPGTLCVIVGTGSKYDGFVVTAGKPFRHPRGVVYRVSPELREHCGVFEQCLRPINPPPEPTRTDVPQETETAA